MRKFSIIILCFVLLLIVQETPGYTAGITSVDAEINSSKQVTVIGYVSSGPGREVTIRITDPLGAIEYTNSTLSEGSGSFRFSYTMLNENKGKYVVTVNAAGVSIPVTTSFHYGTDDDDANLTAHVLIDAGMKVVVTGAINSGAGKQVSIVIMDPSGIIAFVNDTTSAYGGKYEFSFVLDKPVNGRYIVKVGAIGVSAPVLTYFDYTVDVGLKSLSINGATLNPAYHPETTSYEVFVGAATETITVIPTANDVTAVIKVNGKNVSSGKSSGHIQLDMGSNSITVSVTGRDGVTIKTYKVTVNREEIPSNGISVAAELGRQKKVTVSGSVCTGRGQLVTLMIMDPISKIEYLNSIISTDGGAYGLTFTLSNTLKGRYEVSVGAEGFSEPAKTWFIYDPGNADLKSLKIANTILDPAFTPDKTEYRTDVDYSTNDVMVTPTLVDPDATVSVNGKIVESGMASTPVSLDTGSNIINVVVKAQNGALKTYSVTVFREWPPKVLSRDADLSSLVSNTGAFIDPDHFSSDITFYTMQVDEFTPSITLTPTANDPNASITVNGISVASGAASGVIVLNAGDTTINIVVTAEDGTQKTYVVLIRRALSADADLSSLVASTGTFIDPDHFSSDITFYAMQVDEITPSITLTPTANNPNASITVNGISVASGAASGVIVLNAGDTTVNIVVTAEDGTQKTYVVLIRRI